MEDNDSLGKSLNLPMLNEWTSSRVTEQSSDKLWQIWFRRSKLRYRASCCLCWLWLLPAKFRNSTRVKQAIRKLGKGIPWKIGTWKPAKTLCQEIKRAKRSKKTQNKSKQIKSCKGREDLEWQMEKQRRDRPYLQLWQEKLGLTG